MCSLKYQKIAPFFLWLIVGVVDCAAATKYARASTGEYGSEDGSDYENAFDGFSDISGLASGDTLYLCGTFHEEGTISTAGVVVRGDCPGDPFLLDGFDTVSSWSGPDENGEYTADFTAPSASGPTVVEVDGAIYRNGTIGSLESDQWAYHHASTTLYLGSDPSGVTVRAGGLDGGLVLSGSNITALDLEVQGIARDATDDGNSGAILVTGSNVTVMDSSFYATRYAVNCGSSCVGMTVDNISGSWLADGVDCQSGSQCTVKNSSLDHVYGAVTGAGKYFGSGDGEAIASTESPGPVRIQNNRITTGHTGIKTYSDSTNMGEVEITGNRVVDAEGTGISITGVTASVTKGVIAGNSVAGSNGGYTTSWGIVIASVTGQFYIYNNATYNNGASGGNIFCDTGDCVIKNNISSSPAAAGRHIWASGANSLVSDYNDWYGTGTFVSPAAATRTSLAAWQALGYDANSISDDPLLNADYDIDSGSPAWGAGTYVYPHRGQNGKCVGSTVNIGATCANPVPYGFSLKPKRRR